MWVYKGAFHGAINNIIREMNNCVCQFSKNIFQLADYKRCMWHDIGKCQAFNYGFEM